MTRHPSRHVLARIAARIVLALSLATALLASGCSVNLTSDGLDVSFDPEAASSQGGSTTGSDAGRQSGSPVPETVSLGLRHEVSTELTEATVDRVVDGDTLKVRIEATGETERVRLIGINTPESVAPEEGRNTEEGRDASDFVKSLLDKGQTVWLMADTEPYDRYDRLLAYVWLEIPDDFTDPEEVRAKMLNGYIADQGYAVVHAYRPNDAYCDMFHDFADEAELYERGLWEISSTWADGI